MKNGHDHFQCRLLLLFVEIYRNTTTVILYSDGVVLIDGHLDVVAIAGHGLVNGVVYYFVNQMMQTVLADVANVHGRTFTDSFQTFQHLDVAG